MSGWSADGRIGQESGLLFSPENRDSRRDKNGLTTAFIRGCSSDYRWRVRKNGTCSWDDETMTPLTEARGIVYG